MGIRSVVAAIAVVAVLLVLAACAQEYRYLRIRRDLAGDRQALVYPSSALHVATLLKLAPGQELLSGVRDFVAASERAGAKVIYAGKIAVNALQSAQIPAEEWDAFVLAQFPSRDDYGRAAAEPGYQAARSGFANSYAHGMRRSPWLNLAIPVGLLGLRAADVVAFRPARLPFTPALDSNRLAPANQQRQARVVSGLLSNREYGANGIMVLNFLKGGTAEQREANADYGFAMLAMLAEAGAGPMHMGRAVTLEGDAEFDSVALVFYPGVDFFADMIRSEFYARIVGDKQLGDTQAAPSVPLLPHL